MTAAGYLISRNDALGDRAGVLELWEAELANAA